MSARIMNGPDAGEIAASLTERIEQLAIELVGSRPTSRTRSEIRFGRRCGLAVEIAGPKRGIWCDYSEAGIGGDALDLVKHFRRCSTAEALAWARGWLGIDNTVPRPAPRARAPEPGADHEPKANLELARRIWRESVPAAGTPVETYLRSRGLELPPDAPLRFHPECCRGAERLPAMVALMTDPVTARPVGAHRTFLRPDGSGKADDPAKMMLGNAGVIRLVPDDQVTLGLGIAEGIETALAIMQRFGWAPVWAAASAGGIGRFPVLPGVECISVFADTDDKGAGLRSARECAERWRQAGRKARIIKPPAGTDWCDASRRAAA